MVKKFTKRQLLDQCGFNAEETQIILDYQKKLPILVENEEDGFSINARDLWEQLGKPQGKFADWIKRKVTTKKTKGGTLLFVENKDFSTISQKCEIANTGGFKEHLDYFLTIDCAKNVSMMENTDNGALCRKYFILMEDIVIQNKEWLAIRDPEKVEYKKMSKEIDTWCYRIWGHHASRSEYAVEADMLNVIVSGKTSQQLKSEYGVATNELIRDYLKKEHNEELLFLEEQNQVLLLMDMGFTERKNMLTKMHQVKFRNNELMKTA